MNVMHVGFTGTRKGMSESQVRQLKVVLDMIVTGSTLLDTAVFHHGDAVGADKEAAAEAVLLGFDVVSHPNLGDPLQRNRDIVAACDILIAVPEADGEELRSGTWATVRYARQAGKPVVMLSRGVRKA